MAAAGAAKPRRRLRLELEAHAHGRVDADPPERDRLVEQLVAPAGLDGHLIHPGAASVHAAPRVAIRMPRPTRVMLVNGDHLAEARVHLAGECDGLLACGLDRASPRFVAMLAQIGR